MNATRILLLSVVLSAVIFSAVFTQPGGALLPARAAGQTEQERILAVTLQIRVYPCLGNYYEQGLGTVVLFGDQKLILTHNHWIDLGRACKTQLRDARNGFLMDIPQQKFLALVQYQDAGSLLVRLPHGFDWPAVTVDGQAAPQAKAAVLVAHQDPQDPDRVAVMAARVQALNLVGEIPTFTITTPDGARIIKGDSGGSVWFAGKLAGNMWAYYQDQQPATQVSIVALLPLTGLQAQPANIQTPETVGPTGRLNNQTGGDN
jgi:hypothetical protein